MGKSIRSNVFGQGDRSVSSLLLHRSPEILNLAKTMPLTP